METARLIDLSFLTSEEQAVIKNVLNRDSKLKKSEEKRIRKIKKNNFDPGCLKLLTGEWFEELKSKRYLQYSSATDLLQYAFEQEKRGGLMSSGRMSWLSNTRVRSLKILEMMFAVTRPPSESLKREQESATSGSVSEEEISITQVLKDLELIIELEIAKDCISMSNNPGISDVKKQTTNDLFSSELHECGKMEETGPFKQLVSPTCSSSISTTLCVSEKDLPTNEINKVQARDGTENICRGHAEFQTTTFTEIKYFKHSSVLEYSRDLEKPLCSSPCLPYVDMSVCQNKDIRQASPKYLESQAINELSLASNAFTLYMNSECPSNNSEFYDYPSLETESTIEQPTLLAINSPVLKESYLCNDGFLKANVDGQPRYSERILSCSQQDCSSSKYEVQ